jgi:beta-lactamase regulating signal transducer with metallopeptidase domain
MNHLIHSCLLALVFYGLYRILLKGSTGFQWHRFYLLAIPVVAALIPLLVIPIEQTVITPQFLMADTLSTAPVVLNSGAVTTVASPQPIDFNAILLIIYAAGVAISLLVLLYKLARIAQYRDDGVTTFEDGCYVTTVKDLPTAFSFMNRIYMNDAIAEERYAQIILHEKTHVQQRHSWDLLFYEALRIIFWFHPVSYLAQRDLKVVHEHIADQETIAVHGKKSYYQNLLREAFDCPDFSFANPFFQSKTIKTRLAMIQKSQDQKFPFRKLLWMLPILLSSLIYSACTTEPEMDATLSEVSEADKLPSLQDHVFGKKDYYSGVTEQEKNQLLDYKIKMKEYFAADPQPDFEDFLENCDILKIYEIRKKIQKNGSTVVIDEDNGHVLTIIESPDGKVRYQGNPLDEQLNMSSQEYARYITKLKNETSDQQELYAETENIEKVVEIERVDTKDLNGSLIYDEMADVPFAIIENVPTYPGCTGTSEERKACMQASITSFVNENFNTNLARELGLSGKHIIGVQFKINKNGRVESIQSRARDPRLQEEAARVINLLPRMEPGLQRGKEVSVIYALPIIFEIAED